LVTRNLFHSTIVSRAVEKPNKYARRKVEMFWPKDVRAIIVLCVIAMLLLVAVGAAASYAAGGLRPPPVDDPSQSQDVPISPEPPVFDRRVLTEGEAFEIALEGNPTTGYVWEVTEIDEQIVQQTGEEYISDPYEGEFPPLGLGGTYVFRFKAVGSGQTTLNLVYHRPWEKDVEPLKTYIVEIIIP